MNCGPTRPLMPRIDTAFVSIDLEGRAHIVIEDTPRGRLATLAPRLAKTTSSRHVGLRIQITPRSSTISKKKL